METAYDTNPLFRLWFRDNHLIGLNIRRWKAISPVLFIYARFSITFCYDRDKAWPDISFADEVMGQVCSISAGVCPYGAVGKNCFNPVPYHRRNGQGRWSEEVHRGWDCSRK